MTHRPHIVSSACATALAFVLAMPCAAAHQSSSSPAAASTGGTAGTAGAAHAPLTSAEVEQLVAPIALYSDDLLSQVLMASTYPVEIVMADRWAKANASLTGDALAKALDGQTWDASVKSLVNVPQVLTMMSEKIDWTVKLGDAFIASQKQVMDAVQSLRAKASAQGNLKTTEQQTVVVESGPTQVITIQSPPNVIYVPTYNPTVVYGAWPYPSYPPYYYYPPGYNAGAAAVSFGVGVACGMAWGYAWGNCNWRGGDVNVNVNRNTNINNNYINRNNTNINRNNVNRAGGTAGQGAWQHDASHRGGVAYRDSATAQKYGGVSSSQASQARDSFRGRTETGAGTNRAGAASTGAAGSGGSRAGASPTSRQGGSAFSGAGSSGRSASAASNRGASSRSAGSPSRSFGGGGSRGGGARGGRR